MDDAARTTKTTQRWRLEIGRTGGTSKIFVNEEQWFTIRRLRLSCGVDELTTLELELTPTDVQVLMPGVEIAVSAET